jgi:hypothetical protein
VADPEFRTVPPSRSVYEEIRENYIWLIFVLCVVITGPETSDRSDLNAVIMSQGEWKRSTESEWGGVRSIVVSRNQAARNLYVGGGESSSLNANGRRDQFR